MQVHVQQNQNRRRHGRRHGISAGDARRRAVVAAQVAILLTVLMGFAALTVDVGAIYNAGAEAQRAADSAAMAATSMLGQTGVTLEMARDEACTYAQANSLFGKPLQLDPNVDIEFGQAIYDEQTNSYTFVPTTSIPDAVKVTVRLSDSSPNGPLPLYFAGIFGKSATDVSKQAIAMMVPRDIAVVADLSGSMNDDSELRNVHNTPINLDKVWAALPLSAGKGGVLNGSDPGAPGAPTAGDLQPATGPGLPGHVGGNPNANNEPYADSEDHGPRWGWMTTWGTELIPSVYDPVTDTGLASIPRYSTTTDPDVIQNLAESGYTSAEQAALLSSANDSSSTDYRNRVKVLLGLAGWQSGKSGGKYSSGGNGNDTVGSSELTQTVAYPFGGTWDGYLDYVKGSSNMTGGDSDFKYRYGLKTFTNYLLESKYTFANTPELADTPAQPIHAVKEAVAHMAELVYNLDTLDQFSLEIYGSSVKHEVDLDLSGNPFTFFEASERLSEMQAGHYDSWTNMGGGIDQAIDELTESGNQRASSRKVMFLLTDGQANVTESGSFSYTGGKDYARAKAKEAADLGIVIYTISHGYGADQSLMAELATTGGGEHFHAEGSIDEYADELEAIFNTLGGQRPVELIE
ncbi:MAG: VWA domain-containing protein [bacterium]|nr:VWA domain-containing protein [bacterium]